MARKKLQIGVTGAAGFIGSNLCEHLIKNGYQVVAIDDLSKGSKKNVKTLLNSSNFTFVKCDVTNYKNVSACFKKTDVIIHLAASKIPRYGDRLTTLSVNTEGTKNILEIAKKTKAKIIFASTSDVYGKNTNLPFSEESNLVLGSSEVARWAYAVSKIFDEHLIFAHWEKYKVPFIILRLFNVYGPHQHRSWLGGPQSTFIDSIANNLPIEIHGNGKQTRSFTYIEDVIEAFIKTITSRKAQNKIINIGSNEEISINDFATFIATLIKKPLKNKWIKYKSFTGKIYEDVDRKLPDLMLAKKLLDWEPKTTLKDGLLKTIKWHKKNPI